MPIQVICPSCNGRFHAPDHAAGARAQCPKCGGVIDIPFPEISDEIFDAEEEFAIPSTESDFDSAISEEGDRKPCPMCGEMILTNAVKCRYCGEIFDPILKKKELKALKQSQPGADMSTGDWVVAILCSGIGCIAGIVWMIQGKPKGKKMFLVSCATALLWNILTAIIRAIADAGM